MAAFIGGAPRREWARFAEARNVRAGGADPVRLQAR